MAEIYFRFSAESFHQTSTYAVYDACTAVVKTNLALPLRLHVDDLGNLNVSVHP